MEPSGIRKGWTPEMIREASDFSPRSHHPLVVVPEEGKAEAVGSPHDMLMQYISQKRRREVNSGV